MIDLLGWGSSVILIATLMRQVYTQWLNGATAGLSRWLFVGQCSASLGYLIYSYLLHNWVYVCSNLAILITSLVGETLYVRNRRRKELGFVFSRKNVVTVERTDNTA